MRNAHHLDELFHFITRHPGRTAKQLAHMLDAKPRAIESKLVTLEANGYFLSEDPAGALYPFTRIQRTRTNPTCKRARNGRAALTHKNTCAKIKAKGGGIQR